MSPSDFDHAALLAELDEMIRNAPAEAAVDSIMGELALIALEHRDDRATERPTGGGR